MQAAIGRHVLGDRHSRFDIEVVASDAWYRVDGMRVKQPPLRRLQRKRSRRGRYGYREAFTLAWLKRTPDRDSSNVPGRILHDVRRIAVRSLERATVSRSMAMKLTRDKTEAVYRRHAIVNASDLRDAAAKLAALRLRTRQARNRYGLTDRRAVVRVTAVRPSASGVTST